ncbi:MAG: hypothetical protein WC250_01940 [Candidatus Paceibacterota bacterium]|jgi:hypothetical protein
MRNVALKVAVAGFCFAIWPLFMNRSGLRSNIATGIFTAVVLAIVSLPAINQLEDLTKAKWLMILAGGIFGAVGVMAFNSVITQATLKEAGTLFMATVMVQIAVIATYQTVMSGDLSPKRLIGYLCAGLAAFLLLR